MTPSAWLVIAADGFEASLIDRAGADRYAAHTHGLVESLVKDSEMRALLLTIVLSMGACAGVDLADYPTRYRAEVTGLAKVYQGAALALLAGALTPAQAAQVLEEGDRLALQIQAGALFHGVVPGSGDLAEMRDAARGALVVALGAK